MTESALVGRSLTYRYPGAPADAVSCVDLVLQPGRRLALVGANGSGKSTLLLLLKGLLEPDEGTVSVDGRGPREGDPPAHLCAGLVFQNPDNQIVATVVDEDVAFGPENLDVAGQALAARVADALERVGIGHLAAREPHTLSGGEKQRLAIAGALALEPRYLLLDEPTSMLDPQGRGQVRRVLGELASSRSLGMLEVTHDLEEALDADEVVVLSGGRVLASGEPRRVVTDAALLEAAGLASLPATRLARALRAAGVDVAEDAVTAPEVVASL